MTPSKFFPLTTPLFSVGTGTMFRFLLLRRCGGLLGATAAAGLAAVVAGVLLDLRFVVVGLMVWMLVLPGLAAFCWFKYGLSRVNCLNLRPHTLTLDEGGITVRALYPTGNVIVNEEDGGEEEELEERTLRFPRGRLSPASISGPNLFIPVGGSVADAGYLCLPLTEIPSWGLDDWFTALRRLNIA